MFKTPEMRSLVACGLILAVPFGAGCGSSKSEEAKKIEAKRQKIEQKLERTFNSATAEIGNKAVKFIRNNPYDGLITKSAFDKDISITSRSGYEVNISLKKEADTRDIKPGDVTELVITKMKSDQLASDVRIKPAEEDSDEPMKGFEASSQRYDTNSVGNDLNWFVTTNPYEGYIQNPNFDDKTQTLTPIDAANRIVVSANFHFEQATHPK